MKQVISSFQLAIFIANLIVSASLITLPQILTQIANQNAWLTPILVTPFLLGLVVLAVGKGNVLQEKLKQHSMMHRLLKVTVGFLLITIYIRDLRAFTDFTMEALLPKTPIVVTMLLISATLYYICAAGLEVISRITLIQFIVFSVIVLSLPLMLTNEINWVNYMPIIQTNMVANLTKSSFELLPWVGEFVVLIMLLENKNCNKSIKKMTIYGVGFGILLLTILVSLNIAVLGQEIVSKTTYPNYRMIQEIHLTDFLDRLDLVIVILWMPVFLSKLCIVLYLIDKTLFQTREDNPTSMFLFPTILTLGILSMALFKTSMVHLRFTFLTWTIIGLVLEIFIFLFILFIRYLPSHNSE
ncbi:GerAB/ArcD/ProY family transporter [Aquibacillus salsiterrae]|uniref:Endospore germination permease n=1 Tax=Aquibacillus salsiterrae TaxID=2950439 RepID=A0A9X3WFF1_9BACI|nr:endospore germination permease [Aquibacillus salsiterrae]MDC3417315.1 endospore germination permease [Aquibacillus salsiterrae]